MAYANFQDRLLIAGSEIESGGPLPPISAIHPLPPEQKPEPAVRPELSDATLEAGPEKISDLNGSGFVQLKKLMRPAKPARASPCAPWETVRRELDPQHCSRSTRADQVEPGGARPSAAAGSAWIKCLNLRARKPTRIAYSRIRWVITRSLQCFY